MFESEQEFANNIDNLIDHLKHDKSISDLLIGMLRIPLEDPKVTVLMDAYNSSTRASSLTNAKKFTYTSSIISLYGFLESFIENIACEFIEHLNLLQTPYIRLPKEIRDSHLELSMNLLKKVQRSRIHSKEEKSNSIKSIVSNMYSCTQESVDYKLNEKAFAIHSANFRYDSIHNLFCKIGIDSVPRRTLQNEQLIDALAKKYATDTNIEKKIFISLLTTELEDLAQKRNEIAHGSFDGNLESIEIVIERSNIISAFGSSISKLLTDHFYGFIYSYSEKIKLGKCSKVFDKINVFGFEANQGEFEGQPSVIGVGDITFAVNEKSSLKIKYGKIVSLMLNGIKVNEIQLPAISDYAIKVDLEFNANIGKRAIYVSKRN
jgi:hypothetical protein